MRYFKTIVNGYIISISTGCGGVEITKNEYDNIRAAIRSAPESDDGRAYALKEDFTWELYDLQTEEVDEEDAEADYQGQRKQIIKDETVKTLFDRYGVECTD